MLNVGTAHVGEFGVREAIAQAKGELVEALPADGHRRAQRRRPAGRRRWRRRTRARVLSLRRDRRRRALATASTLDDAGPPAVRRWRTTASGPACALLVAGAHQVANAAAAAGAGARRRAGLGRRRRRRCGGRGRSRRWRMELTERADGVVVVNDSLQRQPRLDAGRARRAGRDRRARRAPTVAVLGEMLELGDDVAEHHAEVGALRRAAGHRPARRRGRRRPRASPRAPGGRRAGRASRADAGREQAGELAAPQCRGPGRRPGQGVARRRARDAWPTAARCATMADTAEGGGSGR